GLGRPEVGPGGENRPGRGRERVPGAAAANGAQQRVPGGAGTNGARRGGPRGAGSAAGPVTGVDEQREAGGEPDPVVVPADRRDEQRGERASHEPRERLPA